LEEYLKSIQMMTAAAEGKEETKKTEKIMLEFKCVYTVLRRRVVSSDEVTHGVQ